MAPFYEDLQRKGLASDRSAVALFYEESCEGSRASQGTLRKRYLRKSSKGNGLAGH